MISTRFLPMSCTSPLTVASTMLPRVALSVRSMNRPRWPTAALTAPAGWGSSAGAAAGALRPLHELLQVAHRGLHGLGGLEHLGHDELIVVEEAADLFHA